MSITANLNADKCAICDHQYGPGFSSKAVRWFHDNWNGSAHYAVHPECYDYIEPLEAVAVQILEAAGKNANILHIELIREIRPSLGGRSLLEFGGDNPDSLKSLFDAHALKVMASYLSQ